MLYTHRAHNYAQKPTVVGLCWRHQMMIVDVAECCQQLTDDRLLSGISGVIPFRFWMPEGRKWGVCHFFTKSVSMATSLEISKKRDPDWSSAPKMLSLGAKIAKICLAYLEIICLRKIIKKHKKRKKLENAWQSLAYSLLGAGVSPPTE